MIQIQPLILAGGSGTRLWPLSRELYPKQFLRLAGERSLLQGTVTRIMGMEGMLPPIVVVGEDHRFLAEEQLRQMAGMAAASRILVEPCGRNTAAAIAGAAFFCRRQEIGDAVLLVLPADHLIDDQQEFRRALTEATALAGENRLVTFGITPSAPETGYGYIKKGEGHQVLEFVEKPDRDTAAAYLADGRYYWNSGMFAFKIDVFLEELARHAPEVHRAMEAAVQEGDDDGPFFRFVCAAMAPCPDISIDYALMEKSGNVAVVPTSISWSDVGSWQALWELSAKDADGNATVGDVLLHEVKDSLVHATTRLVAAAGLSDILVVETPDAVLVAPRSRAQDVKKMVQMLKDAGRSEHVVHRTASRPWGSYTILEEGERFKIKRITVNPGVKLSLQMHHHRAEHWVVVKGTAKVTKGDGVYLVHENESTFISPGERHRLENPGVIPLEVIEVQNGSYLGEDDIIRFEDDFGREKPAPGAG